MKNSWENLGQRKSQRRRNLKISDYRAVYPLKNPAKPEKKSSGTKNLLILGGALIMILYYQKNPEKMNNLKDKFYAMMICHLDCHLDYTLVDLN